MKSIIIVLIIYLSLNTNLRSKEMEDKPYEDLEAFEHLIKDNQKKMEMAEQAVDSLEKKWNASMKDVENLKNYDQKLKENVIKSMAQNEGPSEMRFKERKEMETPTTMAAPEIQSNVQQQTLPSTSQSPAQNADVQRFGSVSPDTVPLGSVNPYLGSWAPGIPHQGQNGSQQGQGSAQNGLMNSSAQPMYNPQANQTGAVNTQNLSVYGPLASMQNYQSKLVNPQPVPASPQAYNVPPAQLPQANQTNQLNNVKDQWTGVYGDTPSAVKTSTASTTVNTPNAFGKAQGLPVQTTEVKQTLSPQNTISPVDFKRTPNGPSSMQTVQTITTSGNPNGGPDLAMATGGQAVPGGLGNQLLQDSGAITKNGNSYTYQNYNNWPHPQGSWVHPNGSVWYGNPPKGYTIYNQRGDVINQW